MPVQNNLRSLQDDMSQKFETLVDKMNSHKELMVELEERVQKVTSVIDYWLKSVFSLR